MISFQPMDLSIYIHFPFCVKRCNYCDFNTFAGKQDLIPKYIDAVLSELAIQASHVDSTWQVHTVYFGGGTPSLIPSSDLSKILASIRESFTLAPDPEITLEANPGTLDEKKLADLKEAGVNRLSIGVQSFQPHELEILGRIHTSLEAQKAVAFAKKAGFSNLSLDLIYGLPGQSLSSWQDNLQKAVDLHPAHLSLYSLQLELGTPLERQVRCGELPGPDEDLAAEMYELAMDFLPANYFQQYEISNWACRESDGRIQLSMHNLQYWLNFPYLGIGAGAHGSFAGRRTENVKGIEEYISRFTGRPKETGIMSPANESCLDVSRWDEVQETMMLGLRLTEKGIDSQEFLARFGVQLGSLFPVQIDKLRDQGLLEWAGLEGKKVLRLTRKGRLLGNRVFGEFVGNPEPKGFF